MIRELTSTRIYILAAEVLTSLEVGTGGAPVSALRVTAPLGPPLTWLVPHFHDTGKAERRQAEHEALMAVE